MENITPNLKQEEDNKLIEIQSNQRYQIIDIISYHRDEESSDEDIENEPIDLINQVIDINNPATPTTPRNRIKKKKNPPNQKRIYLEAKRIRKDQ